MSGSGEQWIAVIDPLLGTYEVLDEEITMNTAPSAELRGEGNWEEMTADKTIVFYSLDGETEYFRSGWDTEENKILGIPTENEIGATSWYTNYCFLHVDEDPQERGVELYTFYYRLEDGRNASITIYHDGTYLDNMLTGTGEVTGTWELDGDTYILTAGEGATGGTLVIDKDDATKAVFTPEGGSAMELGPRVRNEVYVFADETGENVVILYDDMSCSIVLSGAQCEGTWEKNADGTPRSVTIADMNETAYITGSGESFEITLDGVLMSTDNEASESALAKADSAGENEEGTEDNGTGRKPSSGVAVAASGSTSYVYYGKIAGYFEAIIELLPGGTATFKCDMHGHQENAYFTGSWSGRTLTIQGLSATISGSEGNYYFVWNDATFTGSSAPPADGSSSDNGDKKPDNGSDKNPDNNNSNKPGSGTNGNQGNQGGSSDNNNNQNTADDGTYVLNGSVKGYGVVNGSYAQVDLPCELTLYSDKTYILKLTYSTMVIEAQRGTYTGIANGAVLTMTKSGTDVMNNIIFPAGTKMKMSVTYASDGKTVKSISVGIPSSPALYTQPGTVTYENLSLIHI